MKFFNKIMRRFIRILIYIIPRNSNIWITGSIDKWFNEKNQPNFIDNSKYLYIYLLEKTDKEVYWLTENKKKYREFKILGYPVLYKYSIYGLWKAIRGKYYFSHYGVSQITNILDSGSTQINMWHGTPLKKIRYDVVPIIKKKKSYLRNKYENITNKNKEFISSTSKYLSKKVLINAFLTEEKYMLNFGYPRTDILGESLQKIGSFCKIYSKELLPLIDEIKKNKKSIIYMPTWRDYDSNYLISSGINFKELNKVLKKNDYTMYLKLHPLTDIKLENLSNIKILLNNIDIYPLLPFTDILITDYSSIYYDYLLLDKEIIFFPFDKEKYLSERDIYFEYEKVTPGIKVYTFLELLKCIENIEKLDYRKERKKIKELFIEDYNFNASEKIIDFFEDKK